MATAARYKLYRIDVDGTPILGIQSSTFRTGIEQRLLGGDGLLYPTHASISAVRPDIEFETVQLVAALTAAGLSGKRVSVGTPVTLYFAKMDQSGILGALQHVKVVINGGILIPMSLRASQFQEAALRYQLFLEWDGTNLPFVTTLSQSLPAAAINATVWGLGPARLNGTAVDGLQSTEITFGIRVRVSGDSGSVYPTFSGINEAQPGVVLTCLDISRLSGLGILGAKVSTTGGQETDIYFRKRELDGSALVADATAEHLRIRVTRGNIAPGDITESEGNSLQQVRIAPRHDGTNTPLQVATNVAIA